MSTQESAPARGPRALVKRVARRYRDWAVPTADGLPRATVLFAFPALLVILGTLLVGLTINGTSSGAYHDRLYSTDDPALIAGHPLAIRSDEWNVGTSWSISQVEQGLPVTNQTIPGGTDAAIPQDMPRADWDVTFRPHLLGYLFLDLDHASAWKWWAPSLLMIAAAYMFVVTILPRRPLAAAALAVGFYFAPFFQWWYQSVTFLPTAWGLVTMTAVIWAIRSRSRAARWGWAAAAGYLTPVMAMSIYAPYIVPVVLVVAAFAVAAVIRMLRERGRARDLLRGLPLLVAGGIGAAVMLIWLQVKQETVEGFLSTAYPGERLTPSGTGNALTLVRTIASPFQESLKKAAGLMGMNSSEASTYFLIGAFLIPIVAWVIVRRARTRRRLPWELMGLVGVILLMILFVFVPGWDPIAHLLYLDRTTDTRIRIGLGLASFAIVPWLIAELESEDRAPGRGISIATALAFLVPQLALGAALAVHLGIGELFHDAPLWILLAVGSALAIYLLARRRTAWGVLAFLAVSVPVGYNVNPIYLGVFDLRESAISEEIQAIDDEDPGSWVGIGSTLPTALLLENGVVAYNGVQGAPSDDMWSEIDPDNEFEYEWNRLGAVSWVAGEGDPTITNPSPDQIWITFDACASFAQKNVEYVVTDAGPIESDCLVQRASLPLSAGDVMIYEVTPAR